MLRVYVCMRYSRCGLRTYNSIQSAYRHIPFLLLQIQSIAKKLDNRPILDLRGVTLSAISGATDSLYNASECGPMCINECVYVAYLNQSINQSIYLANCATTKNEYQNVRNREHRPTCI